MKETLFLQFIDQNCPNPFCHPLFGKYFVVRLKLSVI